MVDMPWGSDPSRKFVTNVGLITSNGPHGDNIMSAEWTHHVSYKPGLIAISIGLGKATLENIRATKEFGVNLAASGQSMLSSVAGNSTGKSVDKIRVLESFGFNFYNGKHIKALMVSGAALNVECKVKQEVLVGDHVLFIGEVVDVVVGQDEPLVYHGGKFLELGESVEKPSEERISQISSAVEKFRKK